MFGFFSNKKNIKAKKNPSFQRKRYFFSNNEKEFFYTMLEVAELLGALLFAKPRLADIILPTSTGERRLRMLNKIQHRHVDFLLCDKKYLSPVAVIELDDPTHETDKSIKKDEFKDKLFFEAGLPIYRQKLQKDYNSKKIAAEIYSMVKDAGLID
jgi:very-short-patch-repair endonuclease